MHSPPEMTGSAATRLSGDGDFDDLVTRRGSPALGFGRLQAELDGFLDVGEGLLASPTLADTPGDQGAFSDEPTILARLENYGEPHAL